MAMAAGGDVLMQCLRDVRELQQQVQAGDGRTAQQLTQIKEDIGDLQRSANALAGSFSTLAAHTDTTRLNHERYFDRIGRMLNVLAEQQLDTRGTLDDHERRLRLLEER
jgi:hypothetical protein